MNDLSFTERKLAKFLVVSSLLHIIINGSYVTICCGAAVGYLTFSSLEILLGYSYLMTLQAIKIIFQFLVMT